MTKLDYITLYKSHPRWELLNMKKALSMFGGFMNSEEDNIRLEAIKTVLRGKK
jgi:hypothetical protein